MELKDLLEGSKQAPPVGMEPDLLTKPFGVRTRDVRVLPNTPFSPAENSRPGPKAGRKPRWQDLLPLPGEDPLVIADYALKSSARARLYKLRKAHPDMDFRLGELDGRFQVAVTSI